MLMDNDLKTDKLLESVVLQEAIQTHVFFLPSFLFPPAPCKTFKLWDLPDTKLKSVLLSVCVLFAAQGVCVVGGSTSMLFSYSEPRKLFCLRDCMCMYSQLDCAVQIRDQRIPVINK